MKLISGKAQVGRFYLGRKTGKNVELLGSHEVGFDTYDDAEGQLAQTVAASTNDTVMIFQVVGEFRARTTLVAVERA